MMAPCVPVAVRRRLLSLARAKARAAGFERISPAGVQRSLRDCFTVSRLDGGRSLVMLFFNVSSGSTLAVKQIISDS